MKTLSEDERFTLSHLLVEHLDAVYAVSQTVADIGFIRSGKYQVLESLRGQAALAHERSRMISGRLESLAKERETSGTFLITQIERSRVDDRLAELPVRSEWLEWEPSEAVSRLTASPNPLEWLAKAYRKHAEDIRTFCDKVERAQRGVNRKSDHEWTQIRSQLARDLKDRILPHLGKVVVVTTRIHDNRQREMPASSSFRLLIGATF